MEEQNEISHDVIEVKQGLTLAESEFSILLEAAKWANLIAILGFIGIGLMVIISFFTGALFSFFPMNHGTPIPSAMGGVITVMYLALSIVYFFPVYYLYCFASKTKQAIRNSDNLAIQKAFSYLKSHYKFLGILSIIMIGMYFLGGLFAAIGFMITKL